ncbi:SxtJ family membrane protein [Glaciecola siphonariae]|uniref:SxtJ family membrane protein n=1 Tax=Glaciecola siphonariae TaxID=521012 RepID=A0ABV9LRM0_9ALTE
MRSSFMYKFVLALSKPFDSIMLPLAQPEDKDTLQSFALTMAVAFPVVFMLAVPWLFATSVPMWPAVVSLLLMVLYIFNAKMLYVPYVLWMIVASILGWLNTKLILALAYFLLIVPMGICMRLLGKLQYKSIERQKSAWQARSAPITKQNLKEPF